MQLKVKDLIVDTPSLFTQERLNIQLEPGECLVVQGEMGCGKTSLFNTLVGIAKPYAGQVLFNNISFELLNELDVIQLRKSQGVIFDRPALLSNQTVEQNLLLCADRFYQDDSHLKHAEQLSFLINEFNVSHLLTLRPHQLSQSQSSIIAIIRALFHQPSILLWDAALSGLDNLSHERMLKKLFDLKQEGVSLVLFSDHTREMHHLADQVLRLKKNEVPGHEAI
ncbi:ATP-binding cassette domain-containing protein [Algibacillus agarilyticus]|uniref:ATP-binding cassette domain-containing protein n=1 Tax=Algibacillus agarilyticus TaxID=2234133 RepID=UPI000DD05198|nr:ATP-binding cassette domain-containing protein [Algibacillus agarilyticus]